MSKLPDFANIPWPRKPPTAASRRRSYPGLMPFRGGPYPAMYAARPWTIRQYAGFSTARDSNAFFHEALAQGQRGLSVAFDLPTHRGYDSDHPEVLGDVGMAGVAISTLGDMQALFAGIPLDGISVSMTMNGAVLPVMAFYILAAEQQGVAAKCLKGTLQNDILKEFMVRNTYIYPPAASMRIVADIMAFTAAKMPKFNPVSVSGYHMHEAGAPAALELGLTLADGLEYLRAAVAAGVAIDEIAPKISFFFATGMDVVSEIAKLRAARQLWAELVSVEFSPGVATALKLRTHCQTSGVSLQASRPCNNLIRTMLEAFASASGGTQSLHTNALDEALALPSDHAARLARNTQLILQHESGICRSADPWDGAEMIEARTDELMAEAREIIATVASLGGMTAAIATGQPQGWIAEAAIKTQASRDSGVQRIVDGETKITDGDDAGLDLRRIDITSVRQERAARLAAYRAGRNVPALQSRLSALRQAARTGEQNLLQASLNAARSGATLGEISQALEEVFGRYQSEIEIHPGVYGQTTKAAARSLQEIAAFATQITAVKGRPPRILMAKLGQDGHDRGLKVMAAVLSDIGFQVELGRLFAAPEDVAVQAAASKPDVIGISTLTAGHLTHLPQLSAALETHGLQGTALVAGGIIPRGDYDALKQAGVELILAPGIAPLEAARRLLNLLAAKSHLNQRI